jgi:hypothetical protein
MTHLVDGYSLSAEVAVKQILRCAQNALERRGHPESFGYAQSM